MKKVLFILVIVISAVLYSCGNKKAENAERDFKRMIVEYKTETEIVGSKILESETAWYDQKNNREAHLVKKTTTFMGVTDNEETYTITDGEWSYYIDLKEKTGTKTNMKDMQEMASVLAGMSDLDDLKSMKEAVEKFGGKMLDNEKFLGKECAVVEMMGTKSWIYKGILLKSEMGGKIIKEAVKIDEGASIPDHVFEVPSGVTMSEM